MAEINVEEEGARFENDSIVGGLKTAVIHTRMKRSCAKEDEQAEIMRKALMCANPAIRQFIGEKQETFKSLCSNPCTEHAQLAELWFSEEGPPKFVDLEFHLTFHRSVHVWVDSIVGVSTCTTPLSGRFLFLFEPDEITKLRSKLVLSCNLFEHIFTHDPRTQELLPNASFFAHGGTWILPSAIDAHRGLPPERDQEVKAAAAFARRPKRFALSFVCGAKRATLGHRIRQYFFRQQEEITSIERDFWSSGVRSGAIPFVGSKTLPAPPCAKLLLFDTMFHVAIENVSQIGYFSEKLLDCFLTRTIPLYWGCPNVGDFFDVEGIIHVFQSDAIAGTASVKEVQSSREAETSSAPSTSAQHGDLHEKLVAELLVARANELTPEDYFRREAAIERNYQLAMNFIDQEKRMQSAIDAQMSCKRCAEGSQNH